MTLLRKSKVSDKPQDSLSIKEESQLSCLLIYKLYIIRFNFCKTMATTQTLPLHDSIFTMNSLFSYQDKSFADRGSQTIISPHFFQQGCKRSNCFDYTLVNKVRRYTSPQQLRSNEVLTYLTARLDLMSQNKSQGGLPHWCWELF